MQGHLWLLKGADGRTPVRCMRRATRGTSANRAIRTNVRDAITGTGGQAWVTNRLCCLATRAFVTLADQIKNGGGCRGGAFRTGLRPSVYPGRAWTLASWASRPRCVAAWHSVRGLVLRPGRNFAPRSRAVRRRPHDVRATARRPRRPKIQIQPDPRQARPRGLRRSCTVNSNRGSASPVKNAQGEYIPPRLP